MSDIVINLQDGTLTATSTPAPLNGGQALLCQAVLVQNDPGSAVNIRVGNASSQSVALRPGEEEVIPVNDVQEIYVKTDSGSARVNWHSVL
jgi:hypothetical protein